MQKIATIVTIALALVVLHVTDVQSSSSVGRETTTAVISSCGTSPSLGTGSDARSGTVKIGSGSSTCTVTFGNAAHEASGEHDAGSTHYAHCVVQSWSVGHTTMAYVVDKNSIVVSGLAAGADWSWVCR